MASLTVRVLWREVHRVLTPGNELLFNFLQIPNNNSPFMTWLHQSSFHSRFQVKLSLTHPHPFTYQPATLFVH